MSGLLETGERMADDNGRETSRRPAGAEPATVPAEPGDAREAPEFTVVIPVKGDPLVDEAVESVLHQTISSFEVVVVDDGSQPPVRLATSDGRVRLVRSETSAGPAGARNAGVRAARGHLVAFLDSDDRFERHRLEDARRAHAIAPVVVAWPNRRGVPTPVPEPAALLDATVPHLGQTSVRREALLLFDDSYPACEDVDWWIRTVTGDVEVALTGREAWTWRRGDHPRPTHGGPARLAMSRRLLDDHQAFFALRPRARAFRWRRIAAFEREHGTTSRSLRAAWTSLAARPTTGALVEAARTVWSGMPGASAGPDDATERRPAGATR